MLMCLLENVSSSIYLLIPVYSYRFSKMEIFITNNQFFNIREKALKKYLYFISYNDINHRIQKPPRVWRKSALENHRQLSQSLATFVLIGFIYISFAKDSYFRISAPRECCSGRFPNSTLICDKKSESLVWFVCGIAKYLTRCNRCIVVARISQWVFTFLLWYEDIYPHCQIFAFFVIAISENQTCGSMDRWIEGLSRTCLRIWRHIYIQPNRYPPR